MRVSDELFRLIKSLSKSEKRYFKLQTSLYGGEKKYLLLFDAIDAQDIYDERAIKERFKGEKFVGQFNVAKKYLYEQILKSLRNKQTETSVRMEIRELIRNVEILSEKGLGDQAGKMLEKGMALASRCEEFGALLELYDWIERMDPRAVESEESIDDLYGDIFATIDRLRDVILHKMALRKVSLPVIPGPPRTSEALAALERAMEPIADEDPASLKSQMLRHWCLATYHFGRSEYPESLDHVSCQLALYEEHEYMIRERPFEYLSALNNGLVLLRRMNEWDRFQEMMEKLRRAEETCLAEHRQRNPKMRAEIFRTASIHQLAMFLSQRNTQRSLSQLHAIEEGVHEHREYLSDDIRLILLYNLVLVHFGLRDFRRALHFNNMILEMQESTRARHSYYHARLLNLLIHFELGNEDLLEYLIKSTYRYFRSRNITFVFEGIVLDFFRKLPRLRTDEDLCAAFVALREQLLPLRGDKLELNGFRMFAYIEWLDAKIAGYGGRTVSRRIPLEDRAAA